MEHRTARPRSPQADLVKRLFMKSVFLPERESSTNTVRVIHIVVPVRTGPVKAGLHRRFGGSADTGEGNLGFSAAVAGNKASHEGETDES